MDSHSLLQHLLIVGAVGASAGIVGYIANRFFHMEYKNIEDKQDSSAVKRRIESLYADISLLKESRESLMAVPAWSENNNSRSLDEPNSLASILNRHEIPYHKTMNALTSYCGVPTHVFDEYRDGISKLHQEVRARYPNWPSLKGGKDD